MDSSPCCCGSYCSGNGFFCIKHGYLWFLETRWPINESFEGSDEVKPRADTLSTVTDDSMDFPASIYSNRQIDDVVVQDPKADFEPIPLQDGEFTRQRRKSSGLNSHSSSTVELPPRVLVTEKQVKLDNKSAMLTIARPLLEKAWWRSFLSLSLIGVFIFGLTYLISCQGS